MNELNVQERIKTIIEAFGLNNRSFSLKLGLDPTVIHNIVTGRKSHPSFSVLEKIILSFDNIDAEWLLTGKGSIYKTPSSNSLMFEERIPEYGNNSKREISLQNEIIGLKGQIEAYKAVIESLSGVK